MTNVLEAIFPILIITGAGYFLALRNILSPSDTDGLSRFVFSVALPMLLFDSLTSSRFPDSFSWTFFIAFYAVAYLVFGLGVLAGRSWFHLVPGEQAILGLGSSYSNLVLVGLPIVVAGLGRQAVLPLLALVSVQNLLLVPLVSIISNPKRSRDSKWQRLLSTIARVAGNPITASLAIAFVFKVLAVQLPVVLTSSIQLIGDAALPCALIVVGASFHKYQPLRVGREVWVLVALKMLLQPLLVGVLTLVVFPIDPLWAAVAVLAAGMPTAVNTFVLAEQIHSGQRIASAAIWLSTLVTIFSQTGLLLLFTARGLV